MDLLSSIRKSGSRGGVNFSWDDVQSSQHRENYLGHSLMAPVGRWQKGKDLNWYAKADSTTNDQETAEEKRARERKEEIRRIKEAEEDALARALGLPVAPRGNGTGANNVEVGELKRVIKETEEGDDDIEEMGKGTGFGDFVGKTEGAEMLELNAEEQKGGLMRRGRNSETVDRTRDNRDRREGGRDKKRQRSRSRERERNRERRHRKTRYRSRSREREHEGRRRDGSPRRERSRSPNTGYRIERNEKNEIRSRRARSRSPDRKRRTERSRSPERRSRRNRSRSPDARRRRYRSRSLERRNHGRDDDERSWPSGRDPRPQVGRSPDNTRRE
ncbi:hypothetical protein ACMFMG_004601 [Clarireedia jacksonii]